MIPLDSVTRVITSVPASFDFSECLSVLNRSTNEVMHVVKQQSVFKLFAGENRLLLGIVTYESQSLVITFEDMLTVHEQASVETYVRSWFDLDRNLDSFETLALTDDILSPIVHAHRGLRMIGIPDLFEALVWAVLGQQITLRFAYSLKRRFVERYGRSLAVDGDTYWSFPKPERLQSVTIADLKELQISTRKAEYILGIAEDIRSGRLDRHKLSLLSSEQRRNVLLEIRGVGEWTADYVQMKCFREADAFPFADAGLHQALMNHFNWDKKPSAEQVKSIGERWKGHRAYATFYLWRSLL